MRLRTGIILIMLFTCMLTLAFDIQSVKADLGAPAITILSPLNAIYPIWIPSEPDPPMPIVIVVPPIPLTFTVNETTSWIGYSLDGQANVTITGNTNLAGLSLGPHSVVVYANDTAGNMGSSETVHFEVAILGDQNGDGVVDIVDLVIVALNFGSESEDPDWNPSADINLDGIVDIVDIVIAALCFGATW